MQETPSQSLEAAYRLIDSITRLKGVIGTLLLGKDAEVIAQDYVSSDHMESCNAFATRLIPELTKGSAELQFGGVDDIVVQTKNLTIRFVHQDAIWLIVFAGENVNIGMLNVELRDRQEQFKQIAGKSITEERDAQMERILETLRTEGSVNTLIEKQSADIGQLRSLHGMLFQIALNCGVTRDVISRRINDINYRLYRDSLLDIGFDFFNRKALDNYDPTLARKVMREQIIGLAGMILPSVKK